MARSSKSCFRSGIAGAAACALILLAVSPSPAAAQAPQGASGSTTTSSSQVCGWSYQCPKTSPCCSEFGYCSSGVGCLAGCNPAGSTSNEYCAPEPVCQSGNYTFADDSRIQGNSSAWNGDATKFDWVVDKQDGSNSSLIQNEELALVLTETGGGTRLSSTRAVLYGSISASIKTVGQAGVVTAWITMSGVKDEIDWEWTGTDTDEAQNNYFWSGDVGTYSGGGTAKASKRDATYHVYGLNWTPDQLQWLVDGKVVRTLTKASTKDGALYKYPQTPSRIQMSVWPAGIEGASQGTLDWAGGMIDWSSSEYKTNGHYAAYIQWINVECYDNSNLATSSSNSSSNSTRRLARREDEAEGLWSRSLVERADSINSYIWGVNDTAGQIQVTGSNAATIINSPYSTGMNMLIKDGDTKGVTAKNSDGSSSLANTAVGSWWNKLGTPAKVGICIGAAAVFLFTLVACCTCIARRKDKKKAKYANLKGADAIPLTAAGASKSQGRLAPQQSNASLASSHKGSYADPYASPEQEYSQQQAWTLGQRQQQQQPTYYPQQQQYMPQQGYAPQQQQQWGGQQQGYGGQQQGWQSQGRY